MENARPTKRKVKNVWLREKKAPRKVGFSTKENTSERKFARGGKFEAKPE